MLPSEITITRYDDETFWEIFATPSLCFDKVAHFLVERRLLAKKRMIMGVRFLLMTLPVASAMLHPVMKPRTSGLQMQAAPQDERDWRQATSPDRQSMPHDAYGRPLRGAEARYAARMAAAERAAAEAAVAEAAAAEAAAAEAAAKSSGDSESRLQPARSPQEAATQLQQMGARVLLPPPDGAENHPDTSWSALAGAAELRHQVEEALVLPLQHPEIFASVRAGTRVFGADRANALLFYGPPGTGKTTAARIAAAQADLPLVYVPLEALMSKWFGKAEQKLAQTFDHCGALGRCVLFLDELDALAGSRSREIDEASRRMLSVLLRRLDGMEAQPGITLVAATNRRTDLDAALLSRFDVRVHFPAPEAPARGEIFALYAKHLQPEERRYLGEAAVGLSGRDILDVCRQAENRWVSVLIRGEVTGPQLPPAEQYEASLMRRLASNSDSEDGAQVVAKQTPRRGAAGGRYSTPGATPRQSASTSGGHWASGSAVNLSRRSWDPIRPPGW